VEADLGHGTWPAAEVFAGPTLTVEDDRQDYGEADYWTLRDNANRTSSVRTA